MKVKRVDLLKLKPEDIKKLYEKHGLRPCSLNINPREPEGCCALGALVAEYIGMGNYNKAELIDMLDSMVGSRIKHDIFGTGFDDGFDGLKPRFRYSEPHYDAGYKAGTLMRQVTPDAP